MMFAKQRAYRACANGSEARDAFREDRGGVWASAVIQELTALEKSPARAVARFEIESRQQPC